MEQLTAYIYDPRNAAYNFDLARAYENDGHIAAAAGFFLRAAVHADDPLFSYEALLRLANCFAKLGGRVYMCKGIFLRAISLMPERPEAYFLLSRLYEQDKEWQECYSFAVMGEKLAEDHPRLRTNVDYPGRYGFTFERAVAARWIGIYDESLHLLRQLKRDPTLLPIYANAVADNLNRLQFTVWREPLTYHNWMYERLRVKFPGARSIERNYSQVYQDMFVLTMLDGKQNGTFFEVGCNDPYWLNNTKLLEEWGWTGISIDKDTEMTARWAGKRKATVITADAQALDYDVLITRDYDYLQIDIDPALQSLNVLFKIPFEKHRFAVITFEHDGFKCPEAITRSRQYLSSHGYLRVIGNISADGYENFEDWYVHPDLVNSKIIDRMLDQSEETKRADRYMLKK
jgi:hypothetical protein